MKKALCAILLFLSTALTACGAAQNTPEATDLTSNAASTQSPSEEISTVTASIRPENPEIIIRRDTADDHRPEDQNIGIVGKALRFVSRIKTTADIDKISLDAWTTNTQEQVHITCFSSSGLKSYSVANNGDTKCSSGSLGGVKDFSSTCSVPLKEGNNKITLTCTDKNSAKDTDSFTIKRNTPPTATIVTPSNQSVTTATSVDVKATCQDVDGCLDAAVFKVNGVQVQNISITSFKGYWPGNSTVSVPLKSGSNTIAVECHDLKLQNNGICNNSTGLPTSTQITVTSNQPATTGGISGTFKIETGAPAEGLTVTAMDSAGNSTPATTDANGLFTISGLAPGTYTVKATKTGYFDFIQTNISVSASYTPYSLGVVTLTKIPVPEYGSISGKVTDVNGNPLSGAAVSISGPTPNTTAESDGSYSFSKLSVGTYSLTVSKTGYDTTSKNGVVTKDNATVLDFQLPKAKPAIFTLSTASVGVTMYSGTMNATKTVTITNTGEATLSYNPVANMNWAILQKNGATLKNGSSIPPGGQDTLTVIFSSSGITSPQQGTFSISHNDFTKNLQSTLSLSMDIIAPPPPPPPPAEQPAPKTPPFMPALYGQCQAQNACYADPVNTAIGNYTYSHTDLAVSSRGPDLVFARSYNSLDQSLGPLGLGWTHSLNISLLILYDGNGDAYLRWGDGRTDRYANAGTNKFTPPPGGTSQLSKAGNQFILSDQDQTDWIFSNEGQLLAVKDGHNNVLTLTYDSQKRLQEATNALGESFKFTYISPDDPKLAAVTDFTGRKVQFGYSGDLLTKVVDVLGKSFGYAYDKGGRLNQLTERDGKVILTNTYDSQGRVIQQSDALGNPSTLAYDTPTPGATTVTNAAGFKTIFAYDALYRLISQTEPTGDKHSILYNTLNLPVEATDLNGQKTQSSYDSHGNLISVTDALGAKWLWTYDVLDRVTSHTTPQGQSYTYGYDTNGNVNQVGTSLNGTPYAANFTYLPTGEVATMTDPMGLVTLYTYTAKGELKSATNANNETTQFTYNALHRHTAITDALSRTWTYAYDTDDHLVSALSPLGQKSSYTYNARGQLSSETHPEETVNYGYNAAGKLTDIATAEGTTTFVYDAINRLTSATTPGGKKTTYGYNALGYLTGIIDPSGKSVAYTYDPMGNLLSSIDTAGQKTVFTVDALGRTIKASDPLGNTISLAYNAEGDVTQAADPDGNTFTTVYDGIGREIQSIDPTNRFVEQQYDKNSRVTQLTTPRGTTFSWAYDKVGRVLSQTYPGGTKNTYTYDAAGQITSITDANNKKISIGYDADGKPKQTSFADGVSRAITYDAANQPSQISFGTTTRGYTYDAAGRIASTTDSWGKTLTYTYTADGLLATITYPGNKTVSYGYDTAGRLTSISDWLGGVTGYAYDSAGRLQQTSYPNGIKTTRSYDANSRVTSIVHKKSDGSVIVSQVMTYDSRGNITSIDTTPEPKAWIKSKFTQYDVNADDQYTNIDDWLLLGYDPVGQMLSKDVDGSEPTKYTFDVRGRLTAATVAGATTSFVYGPEGERIEKSTASQTTRYVVDTNAGLPRVALELDANSAPSTYYIYGLGLVARVAATGNTIQYYHEDIQSNTAALTDKTGVVTDTYFYHPFGRVLAKTGTTANPYQFSGQLGVEQDETGLLYMRARYYDPVLGRFISKDPIGISGGLNQYEYAHNNPLSYADPSGLIAPFVAAAGIGALWGTGATLIGDLADTAITSYQSGSFQNKFSDLKTYGANAIGGAVGGAAFLVGGTFLGAYVDGGVSTGVNSWLHGQTPNQKEMVVNGFLSGGISFGAAKVLTKIMPDKYMEKAIAAPYEWWGKITYGYAYYNKKKGFSIPGTDKVLKPDGVLGNTLYEMKNAEIQLTKGKLSDGITNQLEKYGMASQSPGLPYAKTVYSYNPNKMGHGAEDAIKKLIKDNSWKIESKPYKAFTDLIEATSLSATKVGAAVCWSGE